MQLYIIRHGETDWNAALRVQGREDIPLNETGIGQADACGRAMSSVKLDLIVTSPLQRAFRTAQIVQFYQSGMPQIVVDDCFIERDFGSLSGLTYEERKLVDKSRLEEAENLELLSARIKKGITQYAAGSCQKIAIVTHGGVITQLLSDFSDGMIGRGKTWLRNACISLLRYEQGQYSIPMYNLTANDFLTWLRTEKGTCREGVK